MVRRIKIEKRLGVLKIAEDAYSFFRAAQDDGLVGMAVFSYRHSDRSGGIFFVCGETTYVCVNENGKLPISGKKYGFSCWRFLLQTEGRLQQRLRVTLGMTIREYRLSKIRGAFDFYAPHHHFSFLISHF